MVGQMPRSKLVAELARDDPRPRSRCRIRPTCGTPHESACRDAALTNIRIMPLVKRDARLCRAARGTRDYAAARALPGQVQLGSLRGPARRYSLPLMA